VSSWCKEELYIFDEEYFVKWCTGVDFGVYQTQLRKISSGLLGDYT